jgi:hypothetical protein
VTGVVNGQTGTGGEKPECDTCHNPVFHGSS